MSKDKSFCCIEEKSVKSEKFEILKESPTPLVHKIPAVSQPAPSWSSKAVIESKICDLSSSDYANKYLVLLFYPYNFSFSCPLDLIQFNDCFCEFEKLGANVVAVSTDSEFVHYRWTSTPRKEGGIGEMKIPMLSDRNRRISKDYGVLDEELGISLRALFVIDKKQMIRHVAINDIHIPRSADETLRVIQVCQFVDTYGDVCPFGPKEKITNDIGEPNYFCVANNCNE